VDNLWLCVAITLGMALVIGLAQPFAQPQMNVLQSACFACALLLPLHALLPFLFAKQNVKDTAVVMKTA
jgi:hypothetical protein